MKAALNGGLNLSVLDGWWHEAFDGHNGWAIDSPPWDVEAEDTHDATRLYELIEREVVPLFHDRDEHGVPHRWCRKVKASLRTIGPRFCAGRMVNDYVHGIYPMR
jgi:starch phosphorylase